MFLSIERSECCIFILGVTANWRTHEVQRREKRVVTVNFIWLNIIIIILLLYYYYIIIIYYYYILLLLLYRLANCIISFLASGGSEYWHKSFTHCHSYKHNLSETLLPRWQLKAMRLLSCPASLASVLVCRGLPLVLHGDCKEWFSNCLVAEERLWSAFAKLAKSEY
jgi:hypothetical protein